MLTQEHLENHMVIEIVEDEQPCPDCGRIIEECTCHALEEAENTTEREAEE